MRAKTTNLAAAGMSVMGAQACWLDCLVCPRRHMHLLPAVVRANLFAGD